MNQEVISFLTNELGAGVIIEDSLSNIFSMKEMLPADRFASDVELEQDRIIIFTSGTTVLFINIQQYMQTM